MRKRILAYILAVLMVATALPLTVFADAPTVTIDSSSRGGKEMTTIWSNDYYGSDNFTGPVSINPQNSTMKVGQTNTVSFDILNYNLNGTARPLGKYYVRQNYVCDNKPIVSVSNEGILDNFKVGIQNDGKIALSFTGKASGSTTITFVFCGVYAQITTINPLIRYVATINVTVGEIDKPSNDTVKSIAGNIVKVDCTNAKLNHTSANYALQDDTFSVGDVVNSAVTVTITNTQPYLTLYNSETGKTHAAETTSDLSFRLVHQNNAWVLDTSDNSVTINAKCADPIPTKPTADELNNLGIKATVHCDTKPTEHTDGLYNLIAGSYTVSDPVLNGDVYEATITLTTPASYIAEYNKTNAGHTAASGAQNNLTLKLKATWDEETSAWVWSEGNNDLGLLIHVECPTNKTVYFWNPVLNKVDSVSVNATTQVVAVWASTSTVQAQGTNFDAVTTNVSGTNYLTWPGNEDAEVIYVVVGEVTLTDKIVMQSDAYNYIVGGTTNATEANTNGKNMTTGAMLKRGTVTSDLIEIGKDVEKSGIYNITLDGTYTETSTVDGGLVAIDSDSTLYNSIFQNNTVNAVQHQNGDAKDYGTGAVRIGTQDDADVTMEKCKVLNNCTNGLGAGIFIDHDSEVTLKDCTISGNKTTAVGHETTGSGVGAGVYMSSGVDELELQGTVTITGNTREGQSSAANSNLWVGSKYVELENLSNDSRIGVDGPDDNGTVFAIDEDDVTDADKVTTSAVRAKSTTLSLIFSHDNDSDCHVDTTPDGAIFCNDSHQPVFYTITFKTNGGSLSGTGITQVTANAEYTMSYQKGVGATLPTPSYTGYTFRGWYDNASFTGKAYTALGTDATGDKTFYAKFEPNVPVWKDEYIESGAGFDVICATDDADSHNPFISVTVANVSTLCDVSTPVLESGRWRFDITLKNKTAAYPTTPAHTQDTAETDEALRVWVILENNGGFGVDGSENGKIYCKCERVPTWDDAMDCDASALYRFEFLCTTKNDVTKSVYLKDLTKDTDYTVTGPVRSVVDGIVTFTFTATLTDSYIAASLPADHERNTLADNTCKVSLQWYEDDWTCSYQDVGKVGVACEPEYAVYVYVTPVDSNGKTLTPKAINGVEFLYKLNKATLNAAGFNGRGDGYNNANSLYINYGTLNQTFVGTTDLASLLTSIQTGLTNGTYSITFWNSTSATNNNTLFNANYAALQTPTWYKVSFNKNVDHTGMSSVKCDAYHLDGYLTFYNAKFAAGTTDTVTGMPTAKYGTDIYDYYVNGQKFVLPSAPSRNGYTFLGWSDGTTTFAEGSEYTINKSDVTFTALWKANTVTVTFKPENGEKDFDCEINYGTKVEKPETPVKAGYAFLGWYDGDTEFDFTSTITKDITLTAKWKQLYTVTFDANGGAFWQGSFPMVTFPTTLSYQTNADGKLSALAPDPFSTGYIFLGWYTGRFGGTKVTLDTVYTEDTTVYAHWWYKGGSGGTIIVPDEKPLPDGLNTSDHIAYVRGYEDGTVRPEGKITRAETAMMLFRLLTDEHREAIRTTKHGFTDVPAEAWYREAVATMANGGYITGYEDGTFRGDQPITRAEFVAILSRFISVQKSETIFKDVSDTHWAHDAIAAATIAEWLTGYADGTFGPDRDITRAEAMTIINRALDRGVDATSTLLNFKEWPDNPKTAWYYYEVIEATNDHKYTGKRPNETWTSLK